MGDHSKFEEYIDRAITRNSAINRFLFAFTAIALLVGVFSLFSRQKDLIHENKKLKAVNDSISGRPIKVDTVFINRKIRGKVRIDTIVKFSESKAVVIHDTITKIEQVSDPKQNSYNKTFAGLRNQLSALNEKYNSVSNQLGNLTIVDQHLTAANDSLVKALAICNGRKPAAGTGGGLIKTDGIIKKGVKDMQMMHTKPSQQQGPVIN